MWWRRWRGGFPQGVAHAAKSTTRTRAGQAPPNAAGTKNAVVHSLHSCGIPGRTDSSGRARGTGGAARSSGIGKVAGAVAGHKGHFARCARTGEESTTNPARPNATNVQQIRARLPAGAGPVATWRPVDLTTWTKSAGRQVVKSQGNRKMQNGGTRQSLALIPAISAASIFVKPKHFLPRSLREAPIR